MTPEEHQQRIQELARRVAARRMEHWPEAGAPINELEDSAERLGQEVQREVNAEVLREEAARKDGADCACPCGSRATFQRFHGLAPVTAAGRLRVHWAYYYCGRCRQGHCPADGRLGLGTANTTPLAQA